MRIDIITLFPEVVEPYLNASILKRAQEKKRVRFGVHDLRQWGEGKRRTVDDAPFGGGPGMVLMVAPLVRALRALEALGLKGQRALGPEGFRARGKNGKRSGSEALKPLSSKAKRTRVLLTSAKGKPFTQRDAERYAKKYDRLVILCGRYEGVDERVAQYLADEEVSVGPYVLTGGELPALTITDAVTRLIPGVLGAAESLHDESYSVPRRGGFYTRPSGRQGVKPCPTGETLEYPQFTRPATFSPHRGVRWNVPPVLLSGDHQKIAAWREKMRRT